MGTPFLPIAVPASHHGSICICTDSRAGAVKSVCVTGFEGFPDGSSEYAPESGRLFEFSLLFGSSCVLAVSFVGAVGSRAVLERVHASGTGLGSKQLLVVVARPGAEIGDGDGRGLYDWAGAVSGSGNGKRVRRE